MWFWNFGIISLMSLFDFVTVYKHVNITFQPTLLLHPCLNGLENLNQKADTQNVRWFLNSKYKGITYPNQVWISFWWLVTAHPLASYQFSIRASAVELSIRQTLERWRLLQQVEALPRRPTHKWMLVKVPRICVVCQKFPEDMHIQHQILALLFPVQQNRELQAVRQYRRLPTLSNKGRHFRSILRPLLVIRIFQIRS